LNFDMDFELLDLATTLPSARAAGAAGCDAVDPDICWELLSKCHAI
jgi:hypothetical protein